MIKSRWTTANALTVTIRPPFEERAKAVTARSISPASRTFTGLTSTPSGGAADWIAPNWPVPPVRTGSRRIATRVTPGAICLISSSHFALTLYSKLINPVALPPGRARLSTKPAPTGSGTCTNTIGTVRVACNNGPVIAPPAARMTSGASAANSAACLRILSASPPPQRYSIRTLRPSVQPNCCNPSRNAAKRACPSASSAMPASAPMWRMRCCACAASGQDAAAVPRSVKKSRRLIACLPAHQLFGRGLVVFEKFLVFVALDHARLEAELVSLRLMLFRGHCLLQGGGQLRLHVGRQTGGRRYAARH